ncbi:MAG: M48 family metallopeptidase [Flavobacteriales bacterium]|nr:M48 family metallopeptidase [Flavobacteriales bacterium]
MKKGKIYIDLLILLAIFGGIWGVFAFITLPKVEPKMVELSLEKEDQLGERSLDYLFGEYGVYEQILNEKIQSPIEAIADRLLSNVGLTDYDYKIFIVESPEVNAYTFPGGNIIIPSGLIDFVESPEEFSAVLAHEIGHVEHRHVAKRLINDFGITVLTDFLSNDDSGLLSQIGISAISLSFERQHEREADSYALQLMEESRIEPKYMATFFKRLDEELGSYAEQLEMFSTHPHNNSRIKMATEYETSPDFSAKVFDIDWQQVQDELLNVTS